MFSNCVNMNFNIFALFLIPLVLSLPSLPPHSFEKRVLLSKKNVHDENLGDHTITVKKVFITFCLFLLSGNGCGKTREGKYEK